MPTGCPAIRPRAGPRRRIADPRSEAERGGPPHGPPRPITGRPRRPSCQRCRPSGRSRNPARASRTGFPCVRWQAGPAPPHPPCSPSPVRPLRRHVPPEESRLSRHSAIGHETGGRIVAIHTRTDRTNHPSSPAPGWVRPHPSPSCACATGPVRNPGEPPYLFHPPGPAGPNGPSGIHRPYPHRRPDRVPPFPKTGSRPRCLDRRDASACVLSRIVVKPRRDRAKADRHRAAVSRQGPQPRCEGAWNNTTM